MLTPDEVRAVPLFASLSDADLDRLVRTSADIRLNRGEYAVHEGGERALYAVLSGKFEVVKRFDGVERTLGWRMPGTIFGEVPLAFATPFPGGYRAAEPSRVMRVEPHHYFAIASSAPEVAEKVGALARERIGGLQGIAMQPPKAQITVYGDRWDPACGDLRRFLSRNQIVHDWLAPETPDLRRAWTGDLPEATECPVVRLPDGTQLQKPTLRELAVRLDLQTRPRLDLYDTVIIGGGPAGLAAAVYGASEGLRTLVIEREAPGGQAGTSSRIENYLGFPNGVSGDELASRALQQARRLGAEIVVTRSVERMDPGSREVILDGDERVRALSVIVATGVSWRRLLIDGFERLIGKGIYYGAARSEAPSTHGQDVFLIGAGNSAGQAATALRQSRAPGDAAGARRLAGEEHVALPRRADREQIEHRGPPALRSEGGRRRGASRGHRRRRSPRPERDAPRMRRPVRLHRGRRRHRLAAAAGGARQERLPLDRRRGAQVRRLVAHPRPSTCSRPACRACSPAATCA